MKRTREEDAFEQAPQKKQKWTNKNLHFSTDALVHICSFLQFEDLLQVQLVCKHFAQTLFAHRQCWNHVEFDASFTIPARYVPLISKLKMKKQNCSLNKLVQLKSCKFPSLAILKTHIATLENLTMHQKDLTSMTSMQFPQVKRLTLIGDDSKCRILFAQFPNLNELRLKTIKIDNAASFFVHLEKLTSLKLTGCTLYGKCSPKAFPKLKSLVISKEEDEIDIFDHSIPTLEQLCVTCLCDLEHVNFCPNITTLHVICGADIKQSHMKVFSKLKTLHVNNILPAIKYPSSLRTIHMTNCFKSLDKQITEIIPSIKEVHIAEEKLSWKSLVDLLDYFSNHAHINKCSIIVNQLTGEPIRLRFPPEHITIRINATNAKSVESHCLMQVLNRSKDFELKNWESETIQTMTGAELNILKLVQTYSAIHRYLLDIPDDILDYWTYHYNQNYDASLLKSILFKIQI